MHSYNKSSYLSEFVLPGFWRRRVVEWMKSLAWQKEWVYIMMLYAALFDVDYNHVIGSSAECMLRMVVVRRIAR